LLEGAPDAEIEAIINRHSDISRVDARQIEIASAAAMFGAMLAEDAIRGHQAQSIDELMQHAEQTLSPRPRPGSKRGSRPMRRRGRPPKPGPSKPPSAGRPKRHVSNRTRQRKQANQACACDDLLTLQSMQLDLEQIDSQHLAGLPYARLLHYNQVLREQF